MESTKSKINFALVLSSTIEDANDLKKYIESVLVDTSIVFQTSAPRFERLYIKKEYDGGKG